MSEVHIYTDDGDAETGARLIRNAFDRYGYLQNFGEEIVVADLGCGEGTLLKYLGIEFPQAQLFGIDLNGNIVDRARYIVPTAQISHGSFVATPWDDGAVHVAVSNLIFDYSEMSAIMQDTYTIQDLSRELFRILVPGGIFMPFFGDWSFTFEERVIEEFLSTGFTISETGFIKPIS